MSSVSEDDSKAGQSPQQSISMVAKRMRTFLTDMQKGTIQFKALRKKLDSPDLPYLILASRAQAKEKENECKDMEEILYLAPDSRRICARANVVLIGRFKLGAGRQDMGVFRAGSTLKDWGVSYKRVLQGLDALPKDLRIMFEGNGLSICPTESVDVVCAFLHHHFHFDYVEELRMGADTTRYFLGLTELRFVDEPNTIIPKNELDPVLAAIDQRETDPAKFPPNLEYRPVG